MAGIMNSLNRAAASAKVMAKQAQLSAEISLLKDKILTTKRQFGEEAFDAYGRGDQAFVNGRYAVAVTTINETYAKIQQKQAELDALKRGGTQPVPEARPVNGEITVTVPEGVMPGERITIQTPDHRNINVVIPENSVPGSSFVVPY